MKLLEPIQIGSMRLKNRVVLAATRSGLEEKPTPTEKEIRLFSRLAEGGIALINLAVVSSGPVDQDSRSHSIGRDEYTNGWAEAAKAIHQAGAKACIQLEPTRMPKENVNVSGGRRAAPIIVAGGRAYDINTPQDLSSETVWKMVHNYGDATKRAKEAGFDAVELHFAHGHVAGQFLSPYTNLRTDEWGGDTYGRAKFALEVIKRVRESVGRGFPVICLLTADEHVEGGLTLDEAKMMARLFEEAGVDAFSIRAGMLATYENVVPPPLFPRGVHVPLAAEIKKVVKIPVAVAGNIRHVAHAEGLLQTGIVDYIAMSRALLADPDLVNKVAQDKWKDVRRCTGCNTCNESFATSPNRPRGLVCTVNPYINDDEVDTKTHSPKKVVIIGSGAASLEAARVASLRGHRVTLFAEDMQRLGGRWTWLVRPYIIQMLKDIKEAGGTVRLGQDTPFEDVRKENPDTVIVTNSLEPVLPDIPGTNLPHVHTPDEALDGTVKLGNQVVIIGGKALGCQVAWLLTHRPEVKSITMLEIDRIIARGLEIHSSRVMTSLIQRKGVKALCPVTVTRIEPHHVEYQDDLGRRIRLEADSVILAQGFRQSDQHLKHFAGVAPQVLSVNECWQPREIMDAIWEGRRLARTL